MTPKAMILQKAIDVPHGGIHYEYHLKMVELRPYQWIRGNIDDLPDAPARYRGLIEMICFWNRPPAIGERVQLGSYRLRVIDRNVFRDTVIAVLDNPFSFVPVWQRKFYYARQNIFWRLIATAQVWGIMERPNIADVTISRPAKPLRDYIFVYQRLRRFVARFQRRSA